MLDIAALRERYKGKEISEICFVRGSRKISDDLIKDMKQAQLLDVMRKNRLYIELE